ncbi:SRPBCC domain-containing protein [Mucilaginibacter conchicola]|uniref:SRPBCC domain-containing protein n=1 Tax=Mucilaginibacter conchicola TaxID=2303333 RepID=A0A372NRE0_9SPHI|nr:SRPBCC domain-containing protein [Mucilaginibacter conchicola]RFZ91815.1 SRPBCC domain-containing protein [Mucilaginibacter conchicola]
MATNETLITKDQPNKLKVKRSFNAPLSKVWPAWTQAELLDQWWAPRPWKAITKSLDFSNGGTWLYSMNGPQGEVSWCRVDFRDIVDEQTFSTDVCFCDEDGNKNPDFPEMHWTCNFSEADGVTHVNIDINFDSDTELEKIVAMGFKEGFTMGLGNLDELLAAQ